MAEWTRIVTVDDLPKTQGDYLTWDGRYFAVSYYRNSNGVFGFDNFVTHWMRLPIAPYDKE